MRSVTSGTAGVWAVAKASSLSNFVGFLAFLYPISAKTAKWMDKSQLLFFRIIQSGLEPVVLGKPVLVLGRAGLNVR